MKRLFAFAPIALAVLAISCQTSMPVGAEEFIRVTLNGAVKSPGRYSIPVGTKVDEVMAFAGGYVRLQKEDSYTETPAGLSVFRGGKSIRIPYREWKLKKWAAFRFREGDNVTVDIWIF